MWHIVWKLWNLHPLNPCSFKFMNWERIKMRFWPTYNNPKKTHKLKSSLLDLFCFIHQVHTVLLQCVSIGGKTENDNWTGQTDSWRLDRARANRSTSTSTTDEVIPVLSLTSGHRASGRRPSLPSKHRLIHLSIHVYDVLPSPPNFD